MNLRSRLRRLERLCRPLRDAPRRCPACGAPELSMPSVVVLVEEGFYEPQEAKPPCPACGASGTVVPVDPKTGDPQSPVKVIHLGVDRGRWLERHRQDDVPAPFRRWLQYADRAV